MARITRLPGSPVPAAPQAASVPAAPQAADPAAFAAFLAWQQKQQAKPKAAPTVDPETGEADLSAFKLSLGNVFLNGTKGLGIDGASLPTLTLTLSVDGRTLATRTAKGRSFSTGTVGWNFGGPGIPLGQ